MLDINLLAVITASIGAFLLGGLWYSPLLFEKQWRIALGVGDEMNNSSAITYITAFVLTFLSALVFHLFIGSKPSLLFALGAGLSAGVFWVSGSLWLSYVFEKRPAALYWINGGYHILQFTLYGLVFGLFTNY